MWLDELRSTLKLTKELAYKWITEEELLLSRRHPYRVSSSVVYWQFSCFDIPHILTFHLKNGTYVNFKSGSNDIEYLLLEEICRLKLTINMATILLLNKFFLLYLYMTSNSVKWDIENPLVIESHLAFKIDISDVVPISWKLIYDTLIEFINF